MGRGRLTVPRDTSWRSRTEAGRYTREQLLELAERADAGFDRRVLADLFAMLERYPDRRFAAYGTDLARIAAMRKRFGQWREQLLADQA